jgi:hypothetical protein
MFFGDQPDRIGRTTGRNSSKSEVWIGRAIVRSRHSLNPAWNWLALIGWPVRRSQPLLSSASLIQVNAETPHMRE